MPIWVYTERFLPQKYSFKNVKSLKTDVTDFRMYFLKSILKIRTQGSLHPILKFFDILESVGDMDPESEGVVFLLRLLCFSSHSNV